VSNARMVLAIGSRLTAQVWTRNHATTTFSNECFCIGGQAGLAGTSPKVTTDLSPDNWRSVEWYYNQCGIMFPQPLTLMHARYVQMCK
jgi:hypothetical protein